MASKPDQGSAERLRAILETAVEGIITIDDRGIIESANPAAEGIFGYSVREMVGQNVTLLMPSPYREEHDDYLARYLGTREPRIIGIGREVMGRRKDGSVFPMELSVSEVKLPQKTIFTGFVRDITERKQAEEKQRELAQSLQEKNRELETIVYVASHDLRSPLVNIQGFSRELAHVCEQVQALLKENSSPHVEKKRLAPLVEEDVPEAMSYIQAGVARMDSLLSGFLRFSRLGRAALHPRELDMDQLIGEILKSMIFQIQTAGAQVETAPLPSCYADATQIGQVFTNLLDNALKYRSSARACRIWIEGSRQGDQNVYRVRDNGMGIAPEHREKVFEIFHRLNPVESQGEGLGLSIAQRIVERHGGKIEIVFPQIDAGGACFSVSLPAKPWKA